jgi:hypothetical protein
MKFFEKLFCGMERNEGEGQSIDRGKWRGIKMNISKQMYQNIRFNKQNKNKMSIKMKEERKMIFM